MNSAYIAGMIGALVLSIFFSGIEVAYLSTSPEETKKDIKEKILAFFRKKLTWFIGTTLIGNIGSLILFGVFTTLLLLSSFRAGLAGLSLTVLVPIIVLTFILSAVILYTIELFSKSFFLVNSGRMMSILVIPFLIFFVVMFPLVFAVVSMAKLIINHAFGLEYSKEKPVFGLTDENQ